MGVNGAGISGSANPRLLSRRRTRDQQHSMLLTGSYRRNLDEKLRLALPKQLREQMGFPLQTTLFIGPGTDRSIVVYTQQKLEKLGEAMDRLNPAAKDARAFIRLFYARAQPADVDRQGRMRIPSDLAGISDISTDAAEVVVLGVRDHIEIWSSVAWEEFLAKSQATYDELAESVLGKCSGSTVVSNTS